MIPAGTTPRIPGEEERLAAIVPPLAKPVFLQQWRDLLFLHWEYPAEAIQKTLPEGLYVDCFNGKAYLGVVPFFMQRVHPRFLPSVRGLSDFMELNVRTYVHDRVGVPGVWFYSLDANHSLAVAIGRRFFKLPYQGARMTSSRTSRGMIRYDSVRKDGTSGRCRFEYSRGAELPTPEPDSLEFFLVERYRLYAISGGRLRRGAVAHPPYRLSRAHVTDWEEGLIAANGFPPPGREPDHTVMSAGVNVDIFPLRTV